MNHPTNISSDVPVFLSSYFSVTAGTSVVNTLPLIYKIGATANFRHSLLLPVLVTSKK